MATLELSPALTTELITCLFNPTRLTLSGTTLNASTPFFCGSGSMSSTCCGIHIMKGTCPTSFSGLTSFSVRAADELVFFNSLTGNFSAASYTSGKWNLNTPLVAAVGSGTATWFWGIQTPNSGTTASPLNQQFIGTVGLVGSGADLTISDTNVISGNTYRIASLIVSVPSTYTV